MSRDHATISRAQARAAAFLRSAERELAEAVFCLHALHDANATPGPALGRNELKHAIAGFDMANAKFIQLRSKLGLDCE